MTSSSSRMTDEVGKAMSTTPPSEGDSALVLTRRTYNRWFILGVRLGLFAGFLAIWEGLVSAGFVREFTVSRPSLVADWFVTNWLDPIVWGHFAVTLREAAWGLGIGLVLGVVTAVVFGISDLAYEVTKPYLMALYTVPRIALAPLFILWFGIGETSKVALAVSLVYFVILFATFSAIRSVDKPLVDAMKTMGASRTEIYRHVVIPHSLPHLFSAIRISFGLSLVAVIAGEFIAGNKGLGYLLVRSSNLFHTDEVIALVVVLGILGLVAETLLSRLELRLFAWRPRVDV